MNKITITTSQNIELEFEPGSLGDRIAGAIIDDLIIAGYLIAMLSIFSFTNLRSDYIFLVILFAAPVIFYNLASELLLNGQSAGKKMIGIRVISLSGEQPSFSQYLIRWVFRLIDFTISAHLVGVIMVAATSKHQRLGDLIAGTALVKTKRRIAINDTLYEVADAATYRVSYPEVINLKDNDIYLIKEVILSDIRTRNLMLSLHAQQKIEEILRVKSREQDSITFLQTVLSDYNYLTSQI